MRRWLPLALLLAACSNSGAAVDAAVSDADAGADTLRILPVTPARITLYANQTHEVWVNLSAPTTSTRYVNVINASAAHVSVDPLTLAYSMGKDQQSTTLTAVQPTADQFVPIQFQLAGTQESRTIEVLVKLF